MISVDAWTFWLLHFGILARVAAAAIAFRPPRPPACPQTRSICGRGLIAACLFAEPWQQYASSATCRFWATKWAWCGRAATAGTTWCESRSRRAPCASDSDDATRPPRSPASRRPPRPGRLHPRPAGAEGQSIKISSSANFQRGLTN